ncbi:TPA: hypothetical protein ME573_001799 [Klebsiella pneumoniae]|uniref:hypothetical protein n=1 Tax=Klebsiella pneumoniae TaxID=573 RepID=UPI000CE2C04B|nr:hypothetical protein [Klebsiella pneumoniae]EKX5120687.1 hypothetical protein [Klebsiella pneumoniae]UZI46720.1 hypothetical protein JMW73_23055 [Klebsiella pneumoniae]UZI64923.1 hypothetical protein JMV94_14195 [Klebsiella pneumoniae]UZI72552.1 hypothetical protein JMW76_00750 [Klebsiella pneumoniae]VGG50026.1 Uncharacterised protein [Klebsiella pneumoniae]
MGWGIKKLAAERAALSGEVLAAIEGAAMYTRHGDAEAPRIIVQPAGYTGFIYSEEAAEKWVRRAFIELTPYQVERAVNYLASLVRSHYREQRPKQKRESWMNRY